MKLTLLHKSLAVLFLAGLTLAACWLSPQPELSDAAGVKMELPEFIGPYMGDEGTISEGERLILPPDTQFERMIYRSAEGLNIHCSIILSGSQRGSIHRPEICLPGQGWTVKNAHVVEVPLHNGSTLPVMRLLLSRQVSLPGGGKKTVRALNLYWFVGSDRTTPHHFERIFLTSWDRIFRNRAHRWAYVTVLAPITEDTLEYGGKDEAATLETLKRFIADIVPEFTRPEILESLRDRK